MNKLIKLSISNKATENKRFEIKQSDDEATIYVYDVIVSDAVTAEWMGGIAPEPFIKQLHDIKQGVINLRINSPGGDVFAARAIEQALREHPAKVIAHIDGYAASAATVIAMAADSIEMSSGSFMMIHNSWAMAMGNSGDFLDMASLLEKVDGTIAETYAAKSGADILKIRDWMSAETWFTAKEAVESGLADSVSEGVKANAKWDLSVYDKAPNVDQVKDVIAEDINQKIKDTQIQEIYDTEYLRRKLKLVAGL